MSVDLFEGDCLAILRTLPANCVDSIVTDPPYGLAFMGKRWDYDVPAVAVWQEALRVLKPGGHLLSFGGTRTYHRMVVAIEDAGFEIRDQIGWLYGTGFPKSLDVAKAIDKHQPASTVGQSWQGWGTALKPAWEPIVMARKPFAGTVAANVLAHGTGGINVDECRIESADAAAGRVRHGGGILGAGTSYELPDRGAPMPAGRWPANVIHDGSAEVLEAFTAYGERKAGRFPKVAGAFGGNGIYGKAEGLTQTERNLDAGTAARFFFSAKASQADRAGSNHPTVKPVALMRYLCRLVTPPAGTVLDPFAGSGTTGQAAAAEGFDAILIEREPEYCQDIRRRLALP